MTATLRKPRYQEICDFLRKQLRDGELLPGQRLPSFAQMKEKHGVSQATMDRVFALLEQDGLINREQGRGTFVTYPAERKKTGLIGYIGSDFAMRQRSVYSVHLTEGIEDVIQREEKRLLLLRADSAVGWDQVEGVLVHQSEHDALKHMLPATPHVCILEANGCTAGVVVDEYEGAKMATQHLLGLGHRRIAYLLQIRDVPHLRKRSAGYRDALEEAGIEPGPNWVYDPQTPHPAGGYRQWGYDSMKTWLASGWKKQQFSALIAQNDLAAVGAVEAFREAGLRVPEDVSVVGYDGTEVCDYFSPRITAIEVPLRAIGAKATELLINRINGEHTEEEMIVLSPRLKQGESTAPASKKITVIRRTSNFEGGWGAENRSIKPHSPAVTR